MRPFSTRVLARLAAMLLALSAPLSARQGPAPQSYYAKHWSTANGLPQGTINDLLQTSSGELWIATFAGLLRFDGLRFEVLGFGTLPDLPSNRITALASDGADGLWFATQEGHVVHYAGGRITEIERAPDKVDEIVSLARASDGSLWTQANDGTVRRFGENRWTLAVPPGRPGRFDGLAVNSDGSIAAAVGTDLVLFDASGARRDTLPAGSTILSLAPGSAGRAWIGLADGIARWRGGAVERIYTRPGLRAQAVVEDGADGLWIGTPEAPWHMEPQTNGAIIRSEAPLPTGFDVRSLLRDREGNVWIGGTGQGLVHLRPEHLARFAPSAEDSEIRGLVGDGAEGAWIVVECRGLFHVSSGDWQLEEVALPALPARPGSTPPEPCLSSIWRDARGRIWLGWDGRLLRRDPEPGAVFEPVLPELQGQPFIGPIAETPAGELWIVTGPRTCARVSRADRIVEERAFAGDIVTVDTAPDGSLWIGGRSVVLHLHDGLLESFGPEQGLARGDVRDIHFDRDGSVWIASYGGGLSRLARGRADVVARAQGLPDDSLTRIEEDGQERLWLLSNLGLIVAGREELIDVAVGREARVDPILLGIEAGMPEASHGAPAGFQDELGRLWFGTIEGAVRVDVPEFPFNRTPPLVRIESLEADLATLPIQGELEVPAGTRRLVVGYTAGSLTAPQRVHFRYRLDGFDAAWRAAGDERQASYTGLAPGGYTFRVDARSEEGVWSETPAVLRFSVLAHWWETKWFQFAATLAAGGLLFSLHRLRVARVQRRAASLVEATEGRARAEQRESRLREELAHAGRISTAGELATSLAHEVNQPLAAIVANAQAAQRFLARDGLDRDGLDEILREIAQQGQRASDVIRRLRDFLRKRESSRLPLDVHSIVRDTLPLVRRELLEHKVDLEFDLDPALPAVLADPIEMQQVIVNLVQNACEAMSGHPGTRRVVVATRVEQGRVRIEVRDTGPGLAGEVAGQVFQPYVTTKPSGMGLGLPICRSIVESYGGRMTAESPPEGGALFRIELPACAAAEVLG